MIDIESAEADDIIGTLCREFGDYQKILILSGDKDFIQLQRYINVRQYDPVRKKYITHNDPDKFLFEHILKGDAGDGIPNILSNDNCLVVGERQRPLTQKKIDSFVKDAIANQLDHPAFRNFKRNEQLIDLTKIPANIAAQILDSYYEQEGKKPNGLMNYFIANKLKNLMENVGEFV